jgi:hypothetical protein
MEPVFNSAKAPPYVYEPIYYFFHGTLTNTRVLKKVLGLSKRSRPVLRSAKIIGYSLTNWDQYKALIDGEPGAVVTGDAYMVQSIEHELKLAHYETNAYELVTCEIIFTNNSDTEDRGPVKGYTFKYAGDAQAYTERDFDLTLWEKHMGRRLPPGWKRQWKDEDKVKERKVEEDCFGLLIQQRSS